MFERFTDRARRVVVLAQEDARTLRHSHIGTEHFLLALLHEGDGVAAQALTGLGLTYERVRRNLEDVVGVGIHSPSGHMPFTPRAKGILTSALREAQQLGEGGIDTQHLLLGLLGEEDGIGVKTLIRLGVSRVQVRVRVLELAAEQDEGRTPVAAEDSGAPDRDAPASATPLARLRDFFGGDRDADTPDADSSAPPRPSVRPRGATDRVARVLKYRTADSIGVNLSEGARSGQLGPVADRRPYAERLLAALLRHDRNNALLVGESGVGKTALIAGLAHAIADDPDTSPLQAAEVWQIDHASLWTARTRTLTQPAAERVVLVVEDLDHLLAADRPGPGFAASTLNAICHSSRPLIAAITPAGYAALLADHPLLAAQFHRIDLPPADAEETAAILTVLRERYERHHGVTITDDAIIAAPALAAAHLPGRPLPGGAVELIDHAAARLQAARAHHTNRTGPIADAADGRMPALVVDGALLAEIARDAAA